MSTVCSHCGGTDIEHDQARGDAVCTNCGSVLEDNIIVSEVSFQEQSGGASSVVGQFVSAEGGTKNPLSGTSFYHGIPLDSHAATLLYARRRLTKLGTMLKLNQHCINSAFMFFRMAHQMNLTRGRKSCILDTACLYLVCRSEGTPHLLLDFSDVLQINVYALGRAYLKLANVLHIKPPALDPCLYIHRFAHKLELGDKTHAVSTTALRLVARMKRDWIHHGRRPAGLCGAALLVSARLHNFNRSVREMARVVKVSEGTIRKRLGEFNDTPSSRLTIDEFLKIDLEQEHDPPSFTEAKKKSKHHQVSADGKSARKDGSGDECSSDEVNDGPEETENDTVVVEEDSGGYGGIKLESVQDIIAKARFTESFLTGSATNTMAGVSDNLEELAVFVDNQDEDSNEGEEKQQDGVLDLQGITDEEIDSMLLSEEEVRIKTQLWFAENGDFLKEQEVRRERLAAIKAEKEKNKKKRNSYGKRNKTQHQPATSAGEAIERMLVERKISSKINYDVLRGLSNTGGDSAGDDEASLSNSSTLANDSLPSTSGLSAPVSSSPLAITRTPSTGGRLASLSMRKRTFSALGSSSSSSGRSGTGSPAKFPKLQSSQFPSLDLVKAEVNVHVPPQSTEDNISSSNHPTIDSRIEEAIDNSAKLLDSHVKSHSSDMQSTMAGEGCEGGEAGEDGEGGEQGVEVVEESGPVQYCVEEGLDDVEIEQLAYDEDPLLHSDYEDEDGDEY